MRRAFHQEGILKEDQKLFYRINKFKKLRFNSHLKLLKKKAQN